MKKLGRNSQDGSGDSAEENNLVRALKPSHPLVSKRNGAVQCEIDHLQHLWGILRKGAAQRQVVRGVVCSKEGVGGLGFCKKDSQLLEQLVDVG